MLKSIIIIYYQIYGGSLTVQMAVIFGLTCSVLIHFYKKKKIITQPLCIVSFTNWSNYMSNKQTIKVSDITKEKF